MISVVRPDADFKQAFATHRVSKTNLARYYLRALELQAQRDPTAALGGVIEDTLTWNLEHIMPQHWTTGWAVTEEIAQAYAKRLGNMILLHPEQNVSLGNKPFAEKRPIYRDSSFLLAQEVGNSPSWGPAEIDARQQKLADLALEIWKT